MLFHKTNPKKQGKNERQKTRKQKRKKQGKRKEEENNRETDKRESERGSEKSQGEVKGDTEKYTKMPLFRGENNFSSKNPKRKQN